MRRALPDRAERSRRIVDHLIALPEVAAARHVMAYDAVPGEVETASLVAWCSERGVDLAMPEDSDLAPTWPDVVIVPGTAFTADGHRAGQGGGWYDRFLPQCRPDAVFIGIGFQPQLVESVPIEPHDVTLHCVVVEDGPRWCDGR